MADNNIPGTDDEDVRVDAVLREHLCSRLDGQLGRAAGRFHAHLRGSGSGAGLGGGSRRRSPGFSPGGGWVIGLVGSALAASIAALWAGPSLRLYTPPGTARDRTSGATENAAVVPTPVVSALASSGIDFQMDEQTLSRQTRDGGTVLLDGGRPARRLIRRELRQTRWVDPRTGASLETIEPRQDIMLIQLDTY